MDLPVLKVAAEAASTIANDDIKLEKTRFSPYARTPWVVSVMAILHQLTMKVDYCDP